MADKVININEFRPHVMVEGFKSVHVFPLAMLEDIISGKLKVSEVEEFDDFMPMIIKEWLEGM